MLTVVLQGRLFIFVSTRGVAQPGSAPTRRGGRCFVMFFTYILESEKSQKWYFGHCSSLTQRVKDHNMGQTTSTRNKGPWKLIFARQFDSKLEANRFELKLKKLRNKEYIKREFRQYFIGA